MNERVFNVLFLCTGNSARSILAEVTLNHLGRGTFKAFSAGSHPKGEVHPFALELLQKHRFSIANLRSKSWNEFARAGAPRLDFVFTVCDNAAGETCPIWPGQPMTAHWGIDDPAAVQGTDEERRKAFVRAYVQLNRRIGQLVSLPIAKLDRISLRTRLMEIGELRRKGE